MPANYARAIIADCGLLKEIRRIGQGFVDSGNNSSALLSQIGSRSGLPWAIRTLPPATAVAAGQRRGASDRKSGFGVLIFVQFAECKYHDR
jgi:hypothetical protein